MKQIEFSKMKHFVFVIIAVVLLQHVNAIAQNSPAPIKLVQFVLTPNNADWNYEPGEMASIEISILKFGVPVKNAELKYEYGKEIVGLDQAGTILLKNGTVNINLGTLNEPGFLQLKVKTKIEGYTYNDEVKVAFAPNKIEPTVNFPSDFEEFWHNALAQNAQVPMDPIVTYLPDESTANVDVYLVDLQNYKKGKRLYGYLCKPKAKGLYPVLFCPPGAGIKKIKPYTFYAEQGFISLSIEIHGLSPEISDDDYKNISNAFNDYWLSKLDDLDNYYYKSVYLGCVRAIDFLTSLPEFDGKNVVVTGGSQGGALSIVTAALDKRVTALAAFYPALCDLTGYLNGRAGGWPHLFSERYKTINATPVKIETASYFDVVNFARILIAPGFYSFGYNDHTCPPTSVFSAINVIKAPKKVVVTPISGHWRFNETNNQSIDFLKEQCGMNNKELAK